MCVNAVQRKGDRLHEEREVARPGDFRRGHSGLPVCPSGFLSPIYLAPPEVRSGEESQETRSCPWIR